MPQEQQQHNNKTFVENMQGKLFWEYYSTRKLKESERNELKYFQKMPDEITNMEIVGALPAGYIYTVAGLRATFINLDGTPFDYAQADRKALLEFVNTAIVKLKIGDKDYLDIPLNALIKFPDVGKSLDGATASISNPIQSNVYPLHSPHEIPSERNFNITVTGKTGAFTGEGVGHFGFTEFTALQISMQGQLLRPVQ